jgi:hypothetical protein
MGHGGPRASITYRAYVLVNDVILDTRAAAAGTYDYTITAVVIDRIIIDFCIRSVVVHINPGALVDGTIDHVVVRLIIIPFRNNYAARIRTPAVVMDANIPDDIVVHTPVAVSIVELDTIGVTVIDLTAVNQVICPLDIIPMMPVAWITQTVMDLHIEKLIVI